MDTNHFGLTSNLFSEKGYQFPEFISEVLGINPGYIFVDDLIRPRTALIWSNGIQGFCFVGDENNPYFLRSFNGFLETTIRSKLSNLGLKYFEASGQTPNWNTTIEELLKGRDLKNGIQWIYRFNKQKIDQNRTHSLSTFDVIKVDKKVLSSIDLVNTEHIIDKITIFWGSIDAFLKHGVGYIITDHKVIISCYISGFVAGNVHTLDIETLKNYRRKGFGKIVVRTFIKECIDNHIIPYWDCSRSNLGSRTLAEGVGFEKDSEYLVHYFSFTAG